MTMILVGGGLVLWLGLNVAFVVRRVYVTSPRANTARLAFAYLRRA